LEKELRFGRVAQGAHTKGVNPPANVNRSAGVNPLRNFNPLAGTGAQSTGGRPLAGAGPLLRVLG